MRVKVKGQEGDYIIKNHSSILQYKTDVNGKLTGESVQHIILDSIENFKDRTLISEKLKEIK